MSLNGLQPPGAATSTATVDGAFTVANGVSAGQNVTHNTGAGNSISGGSNASAVLGGGITGSPQKITGTVSYSGIGWGYDDVIETTSVGVLYTAGAHSRIYGTVTHSAILAGSFNKQYAGDYGIIAGGTGNTSGATNGAIGGGSANTLTSTAQSGTLAGGVTGIVHGNRAALLGGISNLVAGTDGTIGGGNGNLNFGTSGVIPGGQSHQLGDGRRVTDAAISASGTTLTSATAAFVAGDAGKTVIVLGAGAAAANTTTGGVATTGAPLITTIASYTDATHVELTLAASTTVSGATLVILGGQSFGIYGTIGGGNTNVVGTTASAQYGTIAGGRLGQVQADYGTVVGGRENQVTGTNGTAIGYGALAEMQGQIARANGYFAAAGDAQASELLMRRQTTNNTATELRLDGSSVRLTLSDLSTYRVEITVIARRTDTRTPASDATWKFTGIATRESGVASVTWTSIDEQTYVGSTAYALGVTADTTNGAISIKGTGTTGHTVNWLADVKLVKVTG